jgi:rhamnose transport system permease protein
VAEPAARPPEEVGSDVGRELLRRLRGWEGLLLGLLVIVVVWNATAVSGYLDPRNQINLLTLSQEKAIIVLAMAFVIIGGEIDLSVASVMALSAVLVAWLFDQGVQMELAIVVAVAVGVLCGLNNGFWVAVVGLPSLAVTLAGLIGYRGVARLFIEDRSIGGFPDWFDAISGHAVLGPLSLSLLLFGVLAAAALVILHLTGFGRTVYVVGNSRDVARFSGVRVTRLKFALFLMSGFVAAVAGVLIASRLGAVRGSTGEGFELDIITIVLFGGVSIFGGRGTMLGVILSIFVILNLRNGLALANMTGNTQLGVIGALLILSVLVPNLVYTARARLARRAAERRVHDDPGAGSGRVESISETFSG